MRIFILPLALLLCTNVAKAQFGKNLLSSSSGFTGSLEKIVQDYRKNYHGVQGKALPAEGGIKVFQSTISLPGSQRAVIYRFHSKKDTTASWQCTLYTGDDYKNAMKVYKTTCRQVNKCRVNIGTAATFKGDFEEPDPNLSFAQTSFKLNTEDVIYKNYYAEVELVNTGMESWEVHLSLQRKKEDDSAN